MIDIKAYAKTGEQVLEELNVNTKTGLSEEKAAVSETNAKASEQAKIGVQKNNRRDAGPDAYNFRGGVGNNRRGEYRQIFKNRRRRFLRMYRHFCGYRGIGRADGHYGGQVAKSVRYAEQNV